MLIEPALKKVKKTAKKKRPFRWRGEYPGISGYNEIADSAFGEPQCVFRGNAGLGTILTIRQARGIHKWLGEWLEKPKKECKRG